MIFDGGVADTGYGANLDVSIPQSALRLPAPFTQGSQGVRNGHAVHNRCRWRRPQPFHLIRRAMLATFSSRRRLGGGAAHDWARWKVRIWKAFPLRGRWRGGHAATDEVLVDIRRISGAAGGDRDLSTSSGERCSPPSPRGEGIALRRCLITTEAGLAPSGSPAAQILSNDAHPPSRRRTGCITVRNTRKAFPSRGRLFVYACAGRLSTRARNSSGSGPSLRRK